MAENQKVIDAVSFLTGRALNDYGLKASRGQAPQSWAEFRAWIVQRFCHNSESETVARLLQLRWAGSLDRLCDEFADIVTQGEPPPDAELIRYFIRALPIELVDLLDHADFQNWMEIKDYLIAKTRPRDYWKNMWLTTVSQSQLDDALRNQPYLIPAPIRQMIMRKQLASTNMSANRPNNRPAGVLTNATPATKPGMLLKTVLGAFLTVKGTRHVATGVGE